MEIVIKVDGMHCKSCEMILSDVLSEIKGVGDVKADAKKGIITLTASSHGAIEEAKKAIAKEGYKVLG